MVIKMADFLHGINKVLGIQCYCYKDFVWSKDKLMILFTLVNELHGHGFVIQLYYC